jgi:dolichyl-phosphate beta-glucosyltransferase
MKVSIVVPAYNEESRIVGFLEDLVNFMKKRGGYEIVVVNDGSTDNTLKVLEKFKRGIKIVSYKKNKGKGGAVREGVAAAKGEKIIFMDADGATSPEEIPGMLRALDDYDLATGTRVSKDSRVLKTQPFHRVLLSKFFNKIVNMLFHLDVKDNLCGFKGFRKDVGKELASEMISNGWEFDVEILARAKKGGYRIMQIPITWHDVGDSKLSSIKDPVKILIRLFYLKFKI